MVFATIKFGTPSFLVLLKKFNKSSSIDENKQLKEYTSKLNSNVKNSMLQSYDLYLNNKYEVVLNQKTIERVRNFFQ